MRLLLPLLITALVAGCSGDAGQEPAPRPRVTRQQRLERAEEAVSKTPTPRVYRYADGELRVLLVPVADQYGLVTMQPCFIWRDAELKTASMQCPSDNAVPDPPQQPGPEDDRQRY